LQWGGEETWPILRRLLDPARPDPVLVVATYRPDALDASPDVEPTLADLRARGVVEEVRLDGLSGRSIRSWVSSDLGGAPAADAVSAALEEVTAGNPFELVTHLRQVVEEAQGGGADPVATVYRFGPEVVDKRLRVFAGLRTLQLAAMVRHAEFSAGLLQEAGAVPPASLAPEALARDLAAAVAARFVKPAGPGRYTFEHDRTLEAVRRTVPVEQGGRDNLALGLVLERRAQAEGARLPVVDLARYFGDAAPVAGGDVWKRALSYAEQAAEEATRRLTYGEVLEFRQRAVDAFRLGEVDLPRREAGLLLEAGRAYSYVGAETRAKPYFEEAREIALDVGLDEVVIEATLGFAGPPEDTWGTDDRLIRWLEDAATRAEAAGHPRAARLRGRAQFERVLAARREPGAYSMPPVADMLERARHGGGPVGLAWALLTRLFGLYTFDQRPADRLALADEARAVAAGCGERDVEAWAQGFRTIHLLELGDRPGAEGAVGGLAELGPLLHHGYARWGAAVIRPLFAHLDGRFAEARRLSDHAFTLRGESLTSVQYQYVQRMLAFREEGNFAGIRPLLEWMGRVLPGGPVDGIVLPVEAARAALACDVGRLKEAREVLDRLATARWQHAMDDAALSTSIALLAEACAATGDLRLVPTLYSLLRHRAHETIVVALAVASLGSVDRYLGILAGLDRRWDDAESHFEEALEVNGMRLRSPTWEAHTQVDFAAMLARRRATGDRERALDLAAAAAATAARLPMPPVLNRARALLSRLRTGG
ncbi:MAG TPA: hypothetical protein VM390_02285, partial [Acidimicrobiales bacterium]|nr:hypothetical protein [Acidimicrobiales bacterium]